MYYPDSAVLVTRFFAASGVGEVVDFMPVVDGTATARHRIVRMLRCVRGRMTFGVDVAPRFDYGCPDEREERVLRSLRLAVQDAIDGDGVAQETGTTSTSAGARTAPRPAGQLA